MRVVLGLLLAWVGLGAFAAFAADAPSVTDGEIWNEGVDYYRAGDVTNALRVLKPLMAGALGVQRPSYWRLHVDTASYSVLTFDSLHGFCLMGLNFTEHLKGLRIIQEFD